MSNIPGGSIVTVVVSDAHSTYNLNSQDVVNAVGAELSAEYDQIKTATVSGGLLSQLTPLITETFQATFTLKPKWDTSTEELTARVSQAFSNVTEQNSSAITIPSFTSPGSLTPQSTGEPQPEKTLGQATTGAVRGIGDSIATFFASIKSLSIGLLVGLGAIVILTLILIAYGPNIGKAVA